MTKTNAPAKSTELVAVLKTHFDSKMNLARVKFISHFIVALCKLQTVSFEKLAIAFDAEAAPSSSLRRIQRFIADFSLNSDLIARLVYNLLPNEGKLTLTIDRTNWKFGQTDINILMLGIAYQGVAFPLMFSMLNKRGNSNSQERIDLVERFIRLFGKDAIDCIVADREFVGETWLSYLNFNNIRYYIRIRNNFKVFVPHKNKEIKASHLFNRFKINQFEYYNKIVRVNGQLCYLSGCKLNNREGKLDFLIIVSFNKPDKAMQAYEKRWQIEMCFRALKTSGFDIEKTHLSDLERIEKLVLLIIVAFVWCYKVGIYCNNIKPIPIKKHGRKAKSIFKLGLDTIAGFFLNAENQNNINVIQFLSCT